MAGHPAAKARWPNSWPNLKYIILTAAPCTGPLPLFFAKSCGLDRYKGGEKGTERYQSLNLFNNAATNKSEIYLNGENVEYLIRDLVVAEKVSEVAAIKEVRDFAVTSRQKMGDRKGIVMDGRDIGTVVFPNAELKIFMTADNAVRVERRFRELYEKNPNITIEEVKKIWKCGIILIRTGKSAR